MRINIAGRHILDRILDRSNHVGAENVDLREMLREILIWANRFVPSESGSILLDDPAFFSGKARPGKARPELSFVACFGKGSASLIETNLPADAGIAGRTYLSGRPYISKEVKEDSCFYSAIDKKTHFCTRSIVCAPIRLKGTTIGVIELLNKLGDINYTRDDLQLLRIFAEYTSTLIQNSLDAKAFEELSIKDNLTGLYNDRFFYLCLAKETTRAARKSTGLCLIFMDLDRFKEVNDAYGHLAGSRVLTEVGGIIHAGLPRQARAVRYGGDEFIVILPGFGLEAASRYAEGLRKDIEEFVFLRRRLHPGARPIMLKGHITSSIGVASLRDNVKVSGTLPEMRDTLIRQADTAMYRSKQAGRNRITIASGKLEPAYPPERRLAHG
ncbi:MAG: sensor domain-containing diguanylate cyclase [Deltaproteobacteria bacterium]|nr:sensor domain-containing diguanylate cyclase [Deltaproteobacteria bacterium]